MFHEKQGDAFTSTTRVGSHRLFLKMIPIRDTADELADLPSGCVKRMVWYQSLMIYHWEDCLD